MSKKEARARRRAAQEAKRRKYLRLAAIVVAVVVVVAAIATIAYFALHKEPGLVIKDLVVGSGEEVQSGDNVTVHYTGWLKDDTQFESSVGGQPYRFTLGQGRVIQGWDQGLVGMKVGGTRRLTIPPKLAYGEAGSGPIPPNATLTFEVELLAVE
jgi:FKBP-type peptidyl-prolyl cis-trans isomerase